MQSVHDLVVCLGDIINKHVGRHIDGVDGADGGHGVGQRDCKECYQSFDCILCSSNTCSKRE